MKKLGLLDEKLATLWHSLAIATQEKDLERARRCVFALKNTLGTWHTKDIPDLSPDIEYEPVDPDDSADTM